MRNRNSPFYQVLNEIASRENAQSPNNLIVKDCKICGKPISHGIICPVCRFYVTNTGSPAYVAKHPEYFEKKKRTYLDVLQETRRQESVEDDFGGVEGFESPSRNDYEEIANAYENMRDISLADTRFLKLMRQFNCSVKDIEWALKTFSPHKTADWNNWVSYIAAEVTESLKESIEDNFGSVDQFDRPSGRDDYDKIYSAYIKMEDKELNAVKRFVRIIQQFNCEAEDVARAIEMFNPKMATNEAWMEWLAGMTAEANESLNLKESIEDDFGSVDEVDDSRVGQLIQLLNSFVNQIEEYADVVEEGYGELSFSISENDIRKAMDDVVEKTKCSYKDIERAHRYGRQHNIWLEGRAFAAPIYDRWIGKLISRYANKKDSPDYSIYEAVEPTLGDMRKNNVETALDPNPVDESESIPSPTSDYSEPQQHEEPGTWNPKEKAVIEKFGEYEPQLGSAEAILKISQELGFPYAAAHEIVSSYQSSQKEKSQSINESLEDDFGDVKGFKKPAQTKILRTRLEKGLGKEERDAVDLLADGGSLLTFSQAGEGWISALHVYSFNDTEESFPKYSNIDAQARKFFNFLTQHNMIKQSNEPVEDDHNHQTITRYHAVPYSMEESIENDIGGVEDFEEPVGLVGQHIVVHVPEDSSDTPNSIAVDYDGAKGIIKLIHGNRVIADIWDEHYKDYVEVMIPRRWLSLEESVDDFGDVGDFETPDAFVQGNVDGWVDGLLGAGMDKDTTLALLTFYRQVPKEIPDGYPNPEYLEDFGTAIYKKIKALPNNMFGSSGIHESIDDFGEVSEFDNPQNFVNENSDEWVDKLLNKGLTKKDTLDLLKFYRELPTDDSVNARHPNHKYLKDFAGEVYRKINDIPDDAFEGTGNIYENKGEIALKNLREGDLNRMKFSSMLEEFLEFSDGEDPDLVDPSVIEGFLSDNYPEFTLEEFMDLYDDFIEDEMLKMDAEDEEYNEWLGSDEDEEAEDEDFDDGFDDFGDEDDLEESDSDFEDDSEFEDDDDIFDTDSSI